VIDGRVLHLINACGTRRFSLITSKKDMTEDLVYRGCLRNAMEASEPMLKRIVGDLVRRYPGTEELLQNMVGRCDQFWEAMPNALDRAERWYLHMCEVMHRHPDMATVNSQRFGLVLWKAVLVRLSLDMSLVLVSLPVQRVGAPRPIAASRGSDVLQLCVNAVSDRLCVMVLFESAKAEEPVDIGSDGHTGGEEYDMGGGGVGDDRHRYGEYAPRGEREYMPYGDRDRHRDSRDERSRVPDADDEYETIRVPLGAPSGRGAMAADVPRRDPYREHVDHREEHVAPERQYYDGRSEHPRERVQQVMEPVQRRAYVPSRQQTVYDPSYMSERSRRRGEEVL